MKCTLDVKVHISPSAENPDSVVAYLEWQGDGYALVSIAKQALTDKDVKRSFEALVTKVVIAFLRFHGFAIDANDVHVYVTNQADLN